MHKRFPAVIKWCSCTLLLLAGCGAPISPAHAQPPGASALPNAAAKPKPKEIPLADRLRSPQQASRPLTDKLRSPRETLKTLYFAVLLYDLFPQMIDDAVACLDLDGLQPRPAAEDAAMLALDLEYVLQSLALPLSGVPDSGGRRTRRAARRGRIQARPCGAARTAAGASTPQTLNALPAMRRAARERPTAAQRRPSTDLREGFTDPRATLRQFIADAARGDFYAAARALDLSSLSTEQRRQQGPVLAQQLAFVMQHRGFMFRQEVPDRPDGPPYTWHADKNGRIALDRVRQPDGKDAWLFTRQTVRNIPRMYAAVQAAEPDPALRAPGLGRPRIAGAGQHRSSRNARTTSPPTSARRGRCCRASSAPWTAPTPTTPGWPTPWNTSTWTTFRSPTGRRWAANWPSSWRPCCAS